MKNKGKFGKKKAIIIAFILFVSLGVRIGNADASAATASTKASEQDMEEIRTNENEPIKLESTQDIETEDSKEAGMGNTSVMQVHFLDVGQALSVLVMDGQGNELLYDAGNEGDAEFICSYLDELGIDRLEYVVNSHPHEDHIGGMDRVLETFEVEQVFLSTKEYDSKAYEDVMHALEEGHVEAIYPKAGTRYNLGKLEIQVLGPLGSDYVNTNDYSVILKIKNANQSVLLVGDSEAISEHELVEAGVDLQADVFQVSHHGSSTSNTIQYLSKINPNYAVISVGADNRYGHPDATILDRLRNMGIFTYETDLDGTIVMTLDESRIFVETFEGVARGMLSEDVGVDYDEKNGKEEQEAADLQAVEPQVKRTGRKIGSPVVITELDKNAEFVVIKNVSSEAVELGGWQLISVAGSQTFDFPEGSMIEANQLLKITSHKANGSGDFIMANVYVWNNDTSDPAQLIDDEGVEVDFFQD
ncbi:hypothetical protein SANA_27650 [Gottschalkiaceae bacterium SANA]|nr:hypothetical protein SANA_27650 [Gottschalkiaceae bacterium SANA]